MAVWNLGSINIDHVYRVPRLPAPGETLAADAYATGLGGKGGNQSVAAARAGAAPRPIGAVGPEGRWARAALAAFGVAVPQVSAGAAPARPPPPPPAPPRPRGAAPPPPPRRPAFGVDVTHVSVGDAPSGHAIIYVDPQAENVIVTFAGANHSATADSVARALATARPGDTLLLQNETSAQPEAARLARAAGLRVIYSAAPFQIAAVRAVLDDTSLLVMNTGEAAELRAAFGALPPIECLITQGAKGAEWISPGTEPLFIQAFRVTPIDTTGAGDCFIGTLAAALDAGLDRPRAMRRAAAAAAIQVTRPGAAQAMPTAAEVDAFLTA